MTEFVSCHNTSGQNVPFLTAEPMSFFKQIFMEILKTQSGFKKCIMLCAMTLIFRQVLLYLNKIYCFELFSRSVQHRLPWQRRPCWILKVLVAHNFFSTFPNRVCMHKVTYTILKTRELNCYVLIWNWSLVTSVFAKI